MSNNKKNNKNNKIINEVRHNTIVKNEIETQETTEPVLLDDLLEEIAVKGKVTCKLLNVRKEPNMNAEIITIIPFDSVVTICDTNATQDFYKVLIGEIEGYCMKEFMTIVE